jgi:dienelactone hydrolase
MRYVLAMMVFLFPLAISAQEKKDTKPGDAMIEKYLAAETDKLSAKVFDGAKTIDEWKAKRPRLYREYMDMLGLWPIPEKTPLKAVKTGEIEAHGVIVESVHFQSKPGLYVTANVYRPKGDANAKRKLPAIVYVCGHSGKGRDGNKTAFQDHGFWFANNGYVCIILDTLQLGEIAGLHHGTYGRIPPRWWWHSIGYSPAAVECWNGVRAIDYLCTRDDVDPDKIGVTGISGGGAATFWIAAADDRVKVAVPVSGMADLESYVKNKVINGHCDCMFLYNTYQWDWTTIAALVAPRPMLFANSDKDPIFPMDANRRVMAKLNKLYGWYGADKAVQEYVSAGGHDYRPDLRKAIFHFFNVHLKRMPTAVVEDSAKYTPLEGRKLRVFPEDKDLPKDAINARVDESFIPVGPIELPKLDPSRRGEKFEAWKARFVSELKKHTFKMPREVMDQKQVYIVMGKRIGDRRDKGPAKGIAVFYTEMEFYQKTKPFDEFVEKHAGDATSQLVLFPRFYPIPISTGPGGYPAEVVHSWTATSPPNYVNRAHALLGYTIDELKVYRLLTSIQSHKKEIYIGENSYRIIGEGQAGIIAAYAALLDPKMFTEITLINPPKSHKEGPHFLNVLRVLDIPEALGLLAPTPLTIIGGLDPAFDRTAEIYRLAGAADKLTRK